MYGGEHGVHGRHMCSVATSLAAGAVVPSSPVFAISSDTFSKDGRKISVDDCALFKPPQDSPPFIGIIRRLISGKEENLRLSVNWLYRPADIKLEKGASVKAAPNELFYSFHKDEILAASLLHPCKVAFLCKGVELPLGISSFVCRRVYDVDNKCLWWLTDQDYINERQEEIDQLLQKTQVDMYGAVQSGGRSPKGLDGTTGNQQLRSSSESGQNINSHLPSQIKIKKRDQVDQGSDPVKRERFSRADDTEFDQFKPEQVLKSEIAKITDRGGLLDYEGVEKLVQLMQTETADKKIDLACKMMLVDVLVVTDKFDCLGWFVQLRGLPVLDGWLQEVHKRKICDGSSPKESEKSVDEFLLVLLRALDKLPVNLHALQTCNVGKSVNHLRSHKNIEIQKKARSLVDTWKKRVEAEMNILDSKSGSSRGSSWPTKSMISEVSPIANRHNGGQPEVNGKSSSAQSSGKVLCAKIGSGDSVTKVITSPNSSKSIISGIKDPISVAVNGSDPLSTIREDKSCSSSHSQNNSQSCSSGLAKTVGSSCREDARSSTAGSMNHNKISVSGSRHRKSTYNFQGSALSGVHKETSSGKSSLNKNVGSEKVSPPGGALERVCDVAVPDHLSSQRLIVRLPNTGRSPARSSTGSPREEPTALSKNSPSALSGKNENRDRILKGKIDDNHDGILEEKIDDNRDRISKGKIDVLRLKTLSKDDLEDKNVLVRSGEGNLSPPGASSNDKKQSADDREKLMEVRGTDLSSRYKAREGNLYDVSFKSMNALVESCVKISEARATSLGGDDIGMNLLATVAAGEISNSDASPSVSRGRNLPVPEESCSGNDVSSRHIDDDTARSEDLACNGDVALVKGNEVDIHVKDGPSHEAIRTLAGLSADKKASLDAVVVISSEDVITKDNVKNGSGESHDDILKDEDINANCTNEKNIENSALNIVEVAASTKPIMKEAEEESPSFSSTERRCQGNECNVLYNISCSGILNEQKLAVAAKTNQGSLVGRSEVCVPPDSVSIMSSKSEHEKTIATTNAVSQAEQTEKKNDSIPSTASDQSKDLAGKPDKSFREEPNAVPMHQTDELIKSNEDEADKAGVAVKLDFDLNEGFDVEDGCEEEIIKSPVQENVSSAQVPCLLPSMSGTFSPSITVASAAKGPFYPPENPFRGKGEFGWKGSAATSAFRPAEPRKTLDSIASSSHVDSIKSKQGRPYLDFDLNVADERDIEDEGNSNVVLDLNRVDQSHEVPKGSLNKTLKMGMSQVFDRSSLSGGFPSADLNSSRDFDLNNGPGPDDVASQITMHANNKMSFISPLPGVRMSSSDQASLSSWYPPGNSYPHIAITPILANRGEQPYPVVPASGSQRIMAHPAAVSSFSPELYRGPVLSSSPALPFPNNAAPFQYPFPFDTNFPMPSNSYPNTSTAYPSLPTPLLGPSGAVPPHYPRAFMMNIPGGTTNVRGDSRRWVGQALDLNSGPGSAEVESRDDRSSAVLRHPHVSGSQAFSTDEQLRMFQMAGGSLKRKEPDGGRDGDRTNYKQLPPWP